MKNLRLHMLRSILTALGIILGIAAVILMLAIAEGSKQSSLRQFEILGARNIIMRSVRPPEKQQMTGNNNNNTSWVTTYGLTRQDLRVIQNRFDGWAELIVPLKSVGAEITRNAGRLRSQAFGTTPDLPKCANFAVESGRYLTAGDLDERSSVCVIGRNIARQLFPLDDPIGKTLRIDGKVFHVVGVLKPIGLAAGTGSALVGRDLNNDIHIPITTAESSFGDLIMRRSAGSRDNTSVELSEIYVSMPTLDDVVAASKSASRIVDVEHSQKQDVSTIVPFELLENAKRVAKTWARVMLAIAAIALIIGGIGIMNIMLASVTERTREIGIRRALGATRQHIIWQFLVETGVLSMLGGAFGVVVGVGGAFVLGRSLPEQFPTQITFWSIAVSFIVACSVGLIFGMYPANVAAEQDPIVALRHD